MHKYLIVIFLTIPFSENSYSQTENCRLTKSKSNDVYHVNKDDILCLSKNSTKNKTLIFTFGIWCSPCRLHLPNAIKIAKDYDVELYILLIDNEEDEKVKDAINFLKAKDKDINIIILKDKQYGKKRNKKYKQFLDEITPSDFKNLNGMSKYILLDKKGNVIMVTNWKDNKENDWKDDSKMIQKKIIPLLKKKT
jgi:thiol-disulfide isomerase/thioredoxin